MKKFLLIIFMLLAMLGYGQGNFETSLHATREGKNDAYRVENGGMEVITGIPMSDLSCQKCHSSTGVYPNGDTIDPATYEPSCQDCHDFDQGNEVAEETCLHCHKRQVLERSVYPDVDVHYAAGLTCTDCHSKEELHGDDGVAYASLKQEGAIKVTCEQCHTDIEQNDAHTIHAETVDCNACHSLGVITCASCHFETVIATGKTRAVNQMFNYKLLVKKNGKVHVGGFMTHTYDGMSNYIVSSYHGHAITKEVECGDCHYNMGGTNAAIEEYNANKTMTLATWNAETKKIENMTGVIPLTADWMNAFQIDFATYTGDPTVFPSDPEAWEYLKSEVDNSHLFYCEPLDSAQLAKLGFTQFPAAIKETSIARLYQNVPNPFTHETKIRFKLDEPSTVKVSVYDVSGRLIKELVNGETGTGMHEVLFNAADIPAGILYAVLEVNGQKSVRKLVHTR
ncbi:MAG: hypothetical protein Kow00127_03230 [Bacteroidales bacterium]